MLFTQFKLINKQLKYTTKKKCVYHLLQHVERIMKQKKSKICVKYASNILYFNISTEIEGRETTINCENEYVKTKKKTKN